MNEKEHHITCPTCGGTIDCRDLDQVLAHGNWDETLQRYVCDVVPKPVEFSSARKVGDPVEYPKNGKPINLN